MEIALSLIARQCLGPRRLGELPRLRSATWAWNRRANQRRTCIHWTFTRKKTRATFGYTAKRSMRLET